MVDHAGAHLAAAADEGVLAAVRSQAYSSISTLACRIVGLRLDEVPGQQQREVLDLVRRRARLAKAYTVFFCVSVGSTAALSPVRCTAAMSPDSAELTLTSLMWWRPPSRTTRTSLVSALP